MACIADHVSWCLRAFSNLLGTLESGIPNDNARLSGISAPVVNNHLARFKNMGRQYRRASHWEKLA